jgi:hypothetical protein
MVLYRRCNLFCFVFKEITAIRCFSGSENVFPAAGKKVLSDHGVNEPAKRGFDIYMDDPEQGDRDTCSGKEGIIFEDVYEVDTSMLKSDLHFLLDFNTGNLAPLGLPVPCAHSLLPCSSPVAGIGDMK